ncbi:MAG TPA: LLM class flavin-dependent oxidoreductase [Candidatus Binataceae bacterium]|nr:LLM class flavin-dependent oxidoreductase [Candidatus Binataceae bacterium]
MKFGLNFPARIDAWKDMVVAEDLGFTSAWFYDSQMLYSDVYSTMALVAEHTRRIKIGTGIAVPSNRIAPVTAHCIATINQMAPGRAMLGIGTGFTGRNMMGLPPVRLPDLRDHVNMCRTLLQGKEALYREGKRERWIRFMHPEHGYINIKDPIPIVIAAQGPKAMELAGEVGDGWMAPVSSASGFRENLDTVCSAARRAGRPLDNFSVTMFAAACVLKPGESLTSPRVLGQMGPIAAVALHALWETSPVAAQLPPTLRPIYERYRDEYVGKLETPADRRYMKVHEGHMIYVKPGEDRFLTKEVIESFSMTAVRERIIEQIKELEAAGLQEIAFSLPNDGARERIQELGREIVAHY